MTDPRAWEQSLGYLVAEVSGIRAEIERLLLAIAEATSRLDERLTAVGQVEKRLAEVRAECQQNDGAPADYGSEVRGVLERRYQAATKAEEKA